MRRKKDFLIKLKNKKKFTILILFIIIFFIYINLTIISINSYNFQISIKNREIITQNSSINLNKYNFNQINKLSQKLKNIEKLKLHDPNFLGAYNFITNDYTNKNSYNKSCYNCVHFSRDVNNNAENQGLRCAFVEITFEEEFYTTRAPHALIGFYTTDMGMIYFEPQTDQNVTLVIGKDYWLECVENGEDKGIGWIIESITHYW